ncbi:Retinal dehydrogenase 1 OS=Equus caballus GN=ALDH1A1 PE=1 SV=1 [Rhizoctonia solani AG-1 IB]|uniref:Retinal dehydrogenase 1 n=1 Tax=Thanatephorus cucumeris (strain AG1-IB / isolate 7/3/14) TaxID=1108050 RepID=A0A0B7FN98_THACB|nr:Retinal dehydrogenase 1 OS=Equus caballus GN=ALDH1A1 PE=1 SV=1 [Rhizoctonia solani AG-1 IB]
MTEYTHIINGKPAISPTTLSVQNPATQKKIGEVPVATKDQLDEAVAAARAAFPAWSVKSQDERAQVLEQIADIVEKNIGEYKTILVSEQGKTLANAEWELGGAVLFLRETAKLRLPEKVIVDNEQTRITEHHVPIGVCAGIVPWNFPLLIAILKIGAPLLAGNTLVLKPSPFTPLATLRLVKDIQAVVPPGVINILSGDDSLGPWITSHPGIDKNNGQACIAAKRLYVHEKIYDQFRDEMAKFAKTVKIGDGADPQSQLGPVQNLMQYKKLLSFVDDAKANGYKFITGGDVNPNPSNGLFMPVSFIDNPPEDSKIVREEPFGPIVPLLKWSDEADVIKRANDTKLGLAASVWGKDLEAAERIAKQLQAGMIAVNGIGMSTPHSAFGGHKESGIGVEGGLNGLCGYSNIQTFALKKQVAFA